MFDKICGAQGIAAEGVLDEYRFDLLDDDGSTIAAVTLVNLSSCADQLETLTQSLVGDSLTSADEHVLIYLKPNIGALRDALDRRCGCTALRDQAGRIKNFACIHIVTPKWRHYAGL